MRVRIFYIWRTVRSSYWFLPGLMALGAALLSVLTIEADRRYAGDFADTLGWLYSGGAEGARAVLAVVAGSVMSTAGVVFSITIAALSLASGQFGPRLLQNFMRDTGNQVVLGTFLATFAFCLLVLRTVRGGPEGVFVPQLSVTVGVALGLASLGVLIFFIHHVAVSIQAPQVVAAVADDLTRHLARIFPVHLTAAERRHRRPATRGELPAEFAERAAPVLSRRDGYVQALDEDALMELAIHRDLVIAVDHRPGHYLVHGEPLAHVWPPERVDEALEREIGSLLVFGPKRTNTQDIEFAIHQLVEVAVRALSPGINDPFTAINCLDRLGSALCHIARREIPAPFRHDRNDRLRVLFRNAITFRGIVDAAFNQIRQYGAGTPAVAIRMLETLGKVLACAGGDPEQVKPLLAQAEMTHRAALAHLAEEADRRDLEARYRAVQRAARSTDDPLADRRAEEE